MSISLRSSGYALIPMRVTSRFKLLNRRTLLLNILLSRTITKKKRTGLKPAAECLIMILSSIWIPLRHTLVRANSNVERIHSHIAAFNLTGTTIAIKQHQSTGEGN